MSKRMCIVLLIGLMNVRLYGGIISEWSRSKASSCAHRGDWAEAQQRMSSLLVDNPDSPELLYDMAIIAYRLNEFEKAELYGEHAAHCANISDSLKERSFFNVGNARVELNKLVEAITAYQEALKIDPHDERAKHNLQKAQEMLEQQKKEEKKKQQGQKKNQEKNAQDDKRNHQENNDQSGQKDHDKNEQQPQKDTQQQQKGQSNPQQSETKREHESGQGKQDQKKQNANNDEQLESGKKEQQDKNTGLGGGEQDKNEQGSKKQEERKEGDKSSDGSYNKKCEQNQKQMGEVHDPSLLDNKKNRNEDVSGDRSQHTKGYHKEQAMSEDEVMEDVEEMICVQEKKLEKNFAPHERWMMRILQEREKDDERANKRITKAMIDKRMAGKSGQNCW